MVFLSKYMGNHKDPIMILANQTIQKIIAWIERTWFEKPSLSMSKRFIMFEFQCERLSEKYCYEYMDLICICGYSIAVWRYVIFFFRWYILKFKKQLIPFSVQFFCLPFFPYQNNSEEKHSQKLFGLAKDLWIIQK